MNKFYVLVVFAFTLGACQFFETEKVSSEELYKEEMENINWSEVDSYPVFSECESFTETEDQKKCFERVLSNHLYASIYSRDMSVYTELRDTIPVSSSISAEGKVAVTHVSVDSSVAAQLPLMDTWIRESIDSLPVLSPATKQGIPVQTEFTLPVVLETENL